MNNNGFKNKAERNKNVVTAAMQIFKDKQMLLARPEGMTRDEYRLLRKIESETLKALFHKGHSPNRRLIGVMGIKQPNVRIQAPTKRRVTQRKSG